MRSIQMDKREKFIAIASTAGKEFMSLQEIKNLCSENDIKEPQWFLKDIANRAGRGMYKMPTALVQNVVSMKTDTKKEVVDAPRISNLVTQLETENLVPQQYKNYVPFGNFDDLVSIFKSNQFFPIFITGQSGNGKTMSVEQACAKLGRKFICVSMTPDTDEGDLLGNYVLINGQMEWRDGPVTVAARQGAVLCIDEIDYGAQNLACLQRVLEGKPFLLKKKNELVAPAEGFTIVATANTKGKGSDDGRFMFTNVLNEAFLERFLNTYEQEYPPVSIEKKIVRKEMAAFGRADNEFADLLVTWADITRKTFAEGGVDEIISTRRLVHICKTYGVHGDRLKAVGLCLNRFDIDTKTSFLDLYTKLDIEAIKAKTPEVQAPSRTVTSDQEIPF